MLNSNMSTAGKCGLMYAHVAGCYLVDPSCGLMYSHVTRCINKVACCIFMWLDVR